MIEVYSWATPNGHKVHVMLEECGLAYRAIPVNIGAGDQFTPEFLTISPNNKIPAIVDPDGPDGEPISIFESGAILLYLAAKTGRFLPKDRARQVRDAGVADVPDGQRRADARPGAPLPPLRAGEDSVRDRSLQQRGQAPLRRDRQAARPEPLHRQPTSTRSPTSPSSRGCARGRTRASTGPTIRHLKGWFDEIAARPAVQRGVEVLAALRKPIRTDQEREVLFGATQYQRR